MATVILKITGIAILTMIVIPTCWIVNFTGSASTTLRVSQIYFRLVALVVGVRVQAHGQLNAVRPLLVVSNHISYLDIIALSAAAPLTYTPKAEIAGWPVLGLCCRLIGCVFVDRRRTKTKENMDNIHQGLKDGKPLVLFAEGTTGNGKHMLPIRSSYFQLVESFDEPISVQPVLIRYERVCGLPLDETIRHKIAWVGDEELGPHAKELLQLGPIDVSIHFLDSVDLSSCKNRKDMAKKCEEKLLSAIASLP